MAEEFGAVNGISGVARIGGLLRSISRPKKKPKLTEVPQKFPFPKKDPFQNIPQHMADEVMKQLRAYEEKLRRDRMMREAAERNRANMNRLRSLARESAMKAIEQMERAGASISPQWKADPIPTSKQGE